MNRLGFHHLAMIKTLAETQSVSATAKALGLTQSAVSHRMKEAERRVDAPLFHRDGRRVALTRAGRRLALAASSILNEAERAELDLEQLARGVDYVIRLGGACYTPFRWFPAFHRQMRQAHPAFDAEIIPDVTEDPLDLILNNTADIVMMIGDFAHAAVQTMPLMEDRLVAVMAAAHPLAAQAWVAADDFARFPYATYHTTPEKGLEYEQVFARAKKLPPEVVSAGRTEVILTLVEDGRTLTIQPLFTVAPSLAARPLVVRPVENGLGVAWHAVLRSGDSPGSPPAVAAQMMKDLLAVL